MSYALQRKPVQGHCPTNAFILCDWRALKMQLMLQWERLTPTELEETGPDRQSIAQLIESKYGIASHMVENYLCNFERTMPLAANCN